MEKKAKITVHPGFRIGTIDPRLYGAFLEPIRNWVYGGIWNPSHETADDMGFRQDVLELVREFELPALRFPGGNWVSGWDWKNSIGPVEQRKCQLDYAWRQYEPNTVGQDEYMEWVKRAKTTPLYTLNLNSASINDAFHLVEYCNHPGGSYWSDLRRKNGHEEPYNIKTWYLGNEVDGSWQIAAWEKDPRGYAVKAHEISKIIKWLCPGAETVICGSSSPHSRNYPAWDAKVLDTCYESVDYVSLHHYHTVPDNAFEAFLNGSGPIEDFITTVVSVCDYIKAKKRSPRKLMISFDEYGAHFAPQEKPVYWWDLKRESQHEFRRETVEQPFVFNDPDDFDKGRRGASGRDRYGQIYSALGLAVIAMTFLRHADRVKIACMTGFLHGAIGISGRRAWKNAAYYPYKHLNQFGRGVSLHTLIDGPVQNIDQVMVNSYNTNPAFDSVQVIEGCSALNEEKEEVTVFFVNRDLKDAISVDLDLRGFEGYQLIEHLEMSAEDLNAANSYENPGALKPLANAATKMENGHVYAAAKRLSWNCVRLGKK
jgi:alpha-N-arabinofuranosidase